MSRPVGTAMQTKPSTAMSRLEYDDEVALRARHRFVRRGPAVHAARGPSSPSTDKGVCAEGQCSVQDTLPRRQQMFGRSRRRFVRRGPAFQAAHGIFSPSAGNGMCSDGWFTPHRSERGKHAEGGVTSCGEGQLSSRPKAWRPSLQ